MKNPKYIAAAVAIAAVLGAGYGATAIWQQADAQAAAPAAGDQAQPRQPGPRSERPSHVEGHIAYLKAELKITPDQQAQFDKVAEALRQNDTERRQVFQQMRGQDPTKQNALQHLEGQARFSAMRAQQTDRFLAAFRPLYDTMSDDQKKAADDILRPHHGHFGGRRG